MIQTSKLTRISHKIVLGIIIGIIIAIFIGIAVAAIIFNERGSDWSSSQTINSSLKRAKYWQDLISIKNGGPHENKDVRKNLTQGDFTNVELKPPYLIIRRDSNSNYAEHIFARVYTNEQTRLSNVKTIVVVCDEGGVSISQYYAGSSNLYIADAFLYYYDVDTRAFLAYDAIENQEARMKYENPSNLPPTLSGNIRVDYSVIAQRVAERFAESSITP